MLNRKLAFSFFVLCFSLNGISAQTEGRFENTSKIPMAVIMFFYVDTGAPTYEYRMVVQLLGSDSLQTSVTMPQISYNNSGTVIGTNHYWIGSADDYKKYLAGKTADQTNSWLMGYAKAYPDGGYNSLYSQKKFFMIPFHPKGGEGVLISDDSSLHFMRSVYY